MIEWVVPQVAPQRYVVQPLGCVVRGQDGTRVHEAGVQCRRGCALRERLQFIEDRDRDVALSALRRRVCKVGDRHEAGRLVKRRIVSIEDPGEML
jgi:hypothetical protein